jgi:hypothetical protein
VAAMEGTPEIQVKGSVHWYPLEEVVFLRQQDLGQKIMAAKAARSKRIQEKYPNITADDLKLKLDSL